ncbi:MAG: hypothetical protein Q8O44_01575 [Syntrophales bacterium]|nr:hypothetical protein [Syntrophales bacterium]
MNNSFEAENVIKEQIHKLSLKLYLWPLSLILIIISPYFLEGILTVLGLIVMAIMFVKSIKLIGLINVYFRMIYELYGPHPFHKRNSLLASYVNIGLVGLGIYLFYQHESLLLISLIIIVSFLLFAGLGVLMSGGQRED